MERINRFRFNFFADEDMGKYGKEMLACKDLEAFEVFVGLLETCVEYLDATEIDVEWDREVFSIVVRHDSLFQQFLILLEKDYVEKWMQQLQEQCDRECSDDETEDENETTFEVTNTGWPDQSEYEDFEWVIWPYFGHI